jgi:glycosyltransferase involved in cell wall biosynthesis
VGARVDGGPLAVAPVGGVRRDDVAAATGDPDLAASGWRLVVDAGPVDGRVGATVEVVVWPAPGEAPVALADVELRFSDGSGSEGPAPVDLVIDDGLVGRIVTPAADAVVAAGPLVVRGWALHPREAVHRVDVLVDGRHAGQASLGALSAPVDAGGIGTAVPFELATDVRRPSDGLPLVKVQAVAQTVGGRPVAVAHTTVVVDGAGVDRAAAPESVTRAGVPPDPAAASLEAQVAELRSVTEGLAAWASDLQRSGPDATGASGEVVADLVAGMDSHREWLTSLERWVSSCVKILSNFGAQPLDSPEPSASGSLDVLGTITAQLEVPAVTAWIAEAADVPEDLTVSVTIATRDRPELLRRAVDSVLGQRYGRFELIVVDDSDGDGAARVLDSIDDPRLRVLRAEERRGAGAAYNLALEAATGEVVAFLDDDNLMHRDWLRSVVWAFTCFPEVEALYGARIREDPGAIHGVRSGLLPSLEFARYDRARHERANFIDRNTLAFRARHADLRYDETLRAAIDWDHSLRLFARTPPLALPVVSCFYRTVVTGRISDLPQVTESVNRVRSRSHRHRPLRVHVHSAMFPVISETYIGDDIAALAASGDVVTVSAVQEPVSVTEGAVPVSLDGDAAIREARPDLVLMHWTNHALGEASLMEEHAVPFVVRVHSFDIDREAVDRLLSHPLCAGVIAHPHNRADLPAGVVGLLPVMDTDLAIPDRPSVRSGLLSVSAGLPKKNFDLLIEAMGQVADLGATIVLAKTNSYEWLPPEVMAKAAERDPRIRVRVSVQRPDVLEEIARASALVYTLDETVPFIGYPMSIVEAMLCGTIVIGPDRPELHEIVGPELRTYRTAEDIAGHLREVESGGPDVDAAREALRRRAQRHRDPVERQRLHDTLDDLLTAWKLRQVGG